MKDWKDFVIEKKAQLFPGQGFDKNTGSITLPTQRYDYRKDPRFARAYSFYRDVAPAIRMRELGVDKLPEEEARAFKQLEDVPVTLSSLKQFDGRYSTSPGWDTRSPTWMRFIDPLGSVLGWRNEQVYIDTSVPDKDYSRVLVHELRHALARRMKIGDVEKLNGIYGFLDADICPELEGYSKRKGAEEMFTTNKEHQFEIYDKLYDELGRPPTAAEYLKAVDDGDYLHQTFSKDVNGYEFYANEYRENSGNALIPKYEGSDSERKAEDYIRKNNVPERYIAEKGAPAPSWTQMMHPSVRSHMEDIISGKKNGRFNVSPAQEIRYKSRLDYYDKANEQLDKKRKDAMKNISRVTNPIASVASSRKA